MEVSVVGRRGWKLNLVYAQAQWIIEDLGLTNSRMTLEIYARPGLRKEIGANGLAGKHPELDLIGFTFDSQLPGQQLVSTVAHEMIHVKQIARGQLRYEKVGKKDKAFWCGKDMSGLPYFERPWEIEAFSKQELLARRFTDALDKKIAKEVKNGKRKRKV